MSSNFWKDEQINQIKNKFETFITMFSYFHPKTRSVLWRILITQSFLYNAITNVRHTDSLCITNFEDIKNFFDIETTTIKSNWKQPNEKVTDFEFETPFKAAEEFLKNRLAEVYGLNISKPNG